MGKLSDALKALFGSNKTTGTYVPLVTSNGTPDGNITMVDLASTLSALTSMGSLTTDCDTLYDMGVYHVASTSATTTYHTPTNYGTLIVFSASKENAAYRVQVFVERTAANFRVFIRTGNRQGGYYAWKILATTTDFSS